MSSGLTIPLPEKYQEITYKNISILRNYFHYNDPIEIWEVGDELSESTRNKLSTLPNVHFKNTTTYDDRINHWRGFQVKGLVAKYTQFDDYIHCDGDVTFFQNPTVIYDSKQYKETGSFIFLDFQAWVFHNLHENGEDKSSSLSYYLARREYIRKLLPVESPYFFDNWRYLYLDWIPDIPVQESSTETGVVYINRIMHSDVIQSIYDMNNDHEETYKYVYGDTATFWLPFVMHNKPFGLNDTYPEGYRGSPIQKYNGMPFYIQKIII